MQELGLEGIKELRKVSPTKLIRGGAPVKVSAEVQHPPVPTPQNPRTEPRVSEVRCRTRTRHELQMQLPEPVMHIFQHRSCCVLGLVMQQLYRMEKVNAWDNMVGA